MTLPKQEAHGDQRSKDGHNESPLILLDPRLDASCGHHGSDARGGEDLCKQDRVDLPEELDPDLLVALIDGHTILEVVALGVAFSARLIGVIVEGLGWALGGVGLAVLLVLWDRAVPLGRPYGGVARWC